MPTSRCFGPWDAHERISVKRASAKDSKCWCNCVAQRLVRDLLARSAEELARVASVTGRETALASSRRVVGLSPVIIAVGVLLLWLLVCTFACLLAVFSEKP